MKRTKGWTAPKPVIAACALARPGRLRRLGVPADRRPCRHRYGQPRLLGNLHLHVHVLRGPVSGAALS